jgi:hypothetical protein
MKFSVSFSWHYDPYRIIIETRLRNRVSPYAHVPKPKVENFMNQMAWEKNTLLDIEQLPLFSSILHTTTPQAPAEKIPRKELSPLVIEVSIDDF